MTQQEQNELKIALCGYLPYGVKGVVSATSVDPHHVDMDGFYAETEFDVDVELVSINTGNDEIFVYALTDNEDLSEYIEESQTDGHPWTIDDFTPYLRPIQGMSQSERIDFANTLSLKDKLDFIAYSYINLENLSIKSIDWLMSHFFDYRNLIDRGLAIESKEGMYN